MDLELDTTEKMKGVFFIPFLRESNFRDAIFIILFKNNYGASFRGKALL